MVNLDAPDGRHEEWAERSESFPYLPRVTGLPPLVAQAAFDALRAARCAPGRPTHWVITVADGGLYLHGDGRVRPPPRPCYWSYREVPGTIRGVGWPVAVPVRLELVPWSATRTAVGLSVRGSHHLGGAGTYQRIGSAAVEAVAGWMEAWPLAELRRLDHRPHAA